MVRTNNNNPIDSEVLISEWHPEKNGALIPSDFAKFSPEKVWWQCKYGHEWQAPVANRTQGNGCPYCCNQMVGFGNDLESISPELSKEWHPTKNNGLLPNMVTPKNPKSAWWLCSKGHEWKTTIYNRACGNGCPYCSGRNATVTTSLQALRPDLASQWHPTLNGGLTQSDVKPGSNKKAWWLCSNGHEWQAMINSRTRGNGCPYCAGRKRNPKTT